MESEYSKGLIEINFAETKKLVHLEERKGNKGVPSAQRKSLAVQSGIIQANKNIKN